MATYTQNFFMLWIVTNKNINKTGILPRLEFNMENQNLNILDEINSSL